MILEKLKKVIVFIGIISLFTFFFINNTYAKTNIALNSKRIKFHTLDTPN
jgi:hypothetical protein